MAYQNLTLRNIAGEMTATFNDNRMRASLPPEPEVGPRLFATGLAKKGLAYEVFRHTNISQSFVEFSSDSEIARIIAGAKRANQTTPLLVSRIGSKSDHFMIKRRISGSFEKENYLIIKPLVFQEADSDREVRASAEQLKMVLMPYVEGNLVRQRVLLATESVTGRISVVYDSERIIRPNGDLIFDTEINVPVGEFLLTPAAFESSEVANFVNNGSYNLTAIKALSELTPRFKAVETLSKWEDTAGADILSKTTLVDVFDSANTNVLNTLADFSNEVINGSAPDYINHCERYAGNEIAYDKLEFENVDFIYCEKCYADTPAVSLSETDNLAKQIRWADSSLGYFWKFIFNGKPYMFMFNESAPFTNSLVADYSYNNIEYEFSDDQKKVGNLLNLVQMNIHVVNGTAQTEVESFFNEKGLIECHVTIPPVAGSNVTVETPFCTMVIAAGHTDLDVDGDELSIRLRPSLIGTSRDLSNYCLAPTGGALDMDPFVISHYELTGDLIPEAVMARLLSFPESGADSSVALIASNVEVREVSFLQQAAQAAYKASTNYSQTIALVPTSPPPASHTGVSTWAGNPASYEVDRNGNIIVTANGTGVLGTKLLAGAVDYRGGVAFGGVMLTNGDDLPNAIPYGIDDTDEALDGFGNPIDLGKHAVVIGAWGYINDPKNTQIDSGKKVRTNQQTSVFVSAAPLIAGVLGGLLPGEEPIGPIRGVIPGILPQQRTPKAVLDNLAALRIAMIDQTGVLSSIYTSALRTSDYSKISSIMSANAILQRVRALCSTVIGTAYKDEQIASLSQQVDGVMRSMVRDGYAQSIDVSFSASRLDRINGVLRTSVRFIPPLSLEAVTIELTLEAPASGINA